MKLLYFDLELPYLVKGVDMPIGGTAIEWSNWFTGFQEINCDISLLTWKGANEFLENTTNIRIVESYNLNKGIPKLRLLFYHFPALYFAIKKSKATHVIQQNATIISGVIALICKLQKKNFVYRIGSDIDSDVMIKEKLSFFTNVFFQYALESSKLIVCQNQYQYNNLIKRFKKKKIIILYNPLNLKTFQQRNILISERRYIAWVGNFRPVKNLQLLLLIATQLPNFEFRIAGKSFKNIDNETELVINNLKGLPNVKFVGYLSREEIIDFLDRSICLLNTSFYEGFSNTFIEALARGIPIVTSSKVDPDNIISNNNLGFLYNNLDEVVTIIKELHKFNYYEFELKTNKFVMDNFNPITLAKIFVTKLSEL